MLKIKGNTTEEKDCVFCKILKGHIPSTVVYRDKDFAIIKDINPKAKLHYLAIIEEHIPFIEMLDENRSEKLGKMLSKISRKVNELGLSNGFRLLINQGFDANPMVAHLHVHILGGEKLPELP